jgi:TolB-like protein
MTRVFLAVTFFSLSVYQPGCTQETLAVLPFKGNGVDIATQKTVYTLLLSEIKQLKQFKVIPQSDVLPLVGDGSCSETACAVDIARQVQATRVAFGSLNKLGEKIICQYNLVEVTSGETLCSGDLGALRVEDLDQVAKQVAASIVLQTPAADNRAVVGFVTRQESPKPDTRKSTVSLGIDCGYLYPQEGYDNEKGVFVWDIRGIYEMQHFAVDVLLGMRKGAALNVGFLYLSDPTDFSPFVGAGVGLHTVTYRQTNAWNDSDDCQDNELNTGLQFLIKGGLLAFRTHDVRVAATVDYSFSLDDCEDRAIVLTIGVMGAGNKVFGIF